MNETFGLWFSGITDGEGCFFIEKQLPSTQQDYIKYRGQFYIVLRADDLATLQYIRKELGFGKLYYKKPRGNSCPQFCFKVTSVEDCYKLIKVFDTYKLRSKKLKDYEVWKEFITYKYDNFRNKNNLNDYISTLELLYSRLLIVRKFTKERVD
uniref:Putative homing endonuclease n=1 Tax=viral metagenome TaxID=1070528 RepID=A0A6M3LBZ0_9ZZZZ